MGPFLFLFVDLWAEKLKKKNKGSQKQRILGPRSRED
jgi:hypothetical protein